MDLYWGRVSTPIGMALLVGSERGVQYFWFDEISQNDIPSGYSRDDGRAQATFQSLLNQPAASIDQFDLQQGTVFQRQVWQALLEIPFGSLSTYQAIADAVARPQAVRAVANGIGANPIAWLIPCHRVIRSDGGLGGYRWGLERKREILKLEKQQHSQAA